MQSDDNEEITRDSLSNVPDSKFARLLKAIKDCPKTVGELAKKSQKEQDQRDLKKKKNKPFNLLCM
jgi:hypothetical protein